MKERANKGRYRDLYKFSTSLTIQLSEYIPPRFRNKRDKKSKRESERELKGVKRLREKKGERGRESINHLL